MVAALWAISCVLLLAVGYLHFCLAALEKAARQRDKVLAHLEFIRHRVGSIDARGHAEDMKASRPPSWFLDNFGPDAP